MRNLVLPLILSILSGLPAAAQDWALGGFDAVGYVHSGRPIPGRGDIATMWKGQVWHFSSEENRLRFEADPRSFAPRFDGMCPVSIVEWRPQPGDPRFFAVIGGNLYLFRSDAAERQLMQDPAQVLDQARAAWGGEN
jgi:YHS domain-containing protein